MSDTESIDTSSSDAGPAPSAPSSEAPTTTTPTDTTPAPSRSESLRDTMARVMESKEAGTEPPKPKGAVDRARDEAGRFANAPKVKPTAPKPPQPSSTASLAPPTPVENTPKKPEETGAAPTLKPPQSWKPLAREKWATLPPEVQAEVSRRETETTQALQGATQYRRLAEAFQQTLAPFESTLRARGLDPLQHLRGVVQAESRLATGTPWEKAQAGAAIISQYGLDVQLLSQALTGQQPSPEQQQAGQSSGYRDPRVDQLFTYLEQQSQTSRQQNQQKLAQSIEEWSRDKEFFEDLREDMAYFHDVAAAQGKAMTFDQSYAAALALPHHEQIRQILDQRKAAQAAAAQAAQVQKQKAASSSIRSQPVTPLRNGAHPTDIRGTLSALFDAAQGDR